MLTPGQCPSPPAATPLEPPTKQWPPAPRPKERYALTSTSSFPSTPRLNFFTKATAWKNQRGRTLADFRQYPSVSTTTDVSPPWAPLMWVLANGVLAQRLQRGLSVVSYCNCLDSVFGSLTIGKESRIAIVCLHMCTRFADGVVERLNLAERVLRIKDSFLSRFLKTNAPHATAVQPQAHSSTHAAPPAAHANALRPQPPRSANRAITRAGSSSKAEPHCAIKRPNLRLGSACIARTVFRSQNSKLSSTPAMKAARIRW